MPTYLSKRSSENGGFIGQSSLLSNQAGVITGYTSPTYVGNLLFTNSDTRTHTLSLSTITGITNGDLVFVLCSVASSTTFPGTYTVSDKTWVPVVNTGVQSIGALYSLMITGYSRYSTRNNSLTFVHADGTYASNFTYEVYVWRNASAVYYPFGFSVNSSSTSATPSIDPAVSLPTLLPNSVLLTTASGTLFVQINTG